MKLLNGMGMKRNFFFFFLNQYSHAAYTMARALGPVRGPAARTGRNLTKKEAPREYTKENHIATIPASSLPAFLPLWVVAPLIAHPPPHFKRQLREEYVHVVTIFLPLPSLIDPYLHVQVLPRLPLSTLLTYLPSGSSEVLVYTIKDQMFPSL